jgi:hypothetical protein
MPAPFRSILTFSVLSFRTALAVRNLFIPDRRAPVNAAHSYIES